MRRLSAVVAVAGAVALGAAALAQPGAPVLHEYVPPAGGAAGAESAYILDPGTAADDAPGTGNPVAVKQNDRYLPAPEATPTRNPAEPLLGSGDAGARREEEATLDRTTEMDGTLNYAEVFNPSIVPFKRMAALDTVVPGPRIVIGDPKLLALPIGGDSRPDRDLFWGSIVLELAPGREVAIPSVAPDMRILSYEAEPAIRVTFLRDGADNYYLRSDDPTARGPHRVVFLVDAPASYFGADIPRGLRLGEVLMATRARPVPADVRATALALAAEMGVKPGDDLARALDRLVAYYRSFEPGEPPQGRDLYAALTRARVGVCRHRAFSFVVTANALGLPARYVRNEAHAFAEVWVTGPGWIRVDLGGAALELDVANAGDKAMHQPRLPDPFPKPTEYTQNYSRLNGPVDGLTPSQIEEAGETAGADGGPGGGNGNGGNGGTGPDGASSADASGDASSQSTADTAPRGLPHVRVSDGPTGRARTRITVTSADESGYRNDLLSVEGRVETGDGRGAGGLMVEIYLKPAGGDDADARLVGHTVSGGDGAFRARLRLPASLELGNHEVFAATPGDARHDGALSR